MNYRSTFLAFFVVILTLLGGAACGTSPAVTAAEALTGGRASEGRHVIYTYGCGSCHVIPGISEATGTVGPPLTGFASRTYIGGLLVNTPPNLFRWVREPQQVDPKTAMPNLGVTDQQAHDIAAYLYTLH